MTGAERSGPVAIPEQRPGRTIVGMSAVLLPFHDDSSIDWDAFAAGVDRTAAAGLVPAVNMDTGYGPGLDPATRRRVLDATVAALGGRVPVPGWTFVAGAHVDGPAPARPLHQSSNRAPAAGAPPGSWVVAAPTDEPPDRAPAAGASPSTQLVAAPTDDADTDEPPEPPPAGHSPEVDLDGYRAAVAEIADAGGVPIVFPSAGLAALPEGDVAPVHAAIAAEVDRLLGFELGRQFHPYGRIWSLATYGEVLEIPQVVGAKHSSLERAPEWDRLALRDRRRPGFLVLTGNDLAIDMVRWGSDYLLGLSTLAPEAFARRDRLWAAGDGRALALDDALQALGAVAFRPPVPAYRHDAVLVWRARGWAPSARVHPASPTRPAGEAELLAALLDRLDAVMAATSPAVRAAPTDPTTHPGRAGAVHAHGTDTAGARVDEAAEAGS